MKFVAQESGKGCCKLELNFNFISFSFSSVILVLNERKRGHGIEIKSLSEAHFVF